MSTAVLALVLPIIAALAARRLRRLAWLTRVTSWSMYPTLSPGDRVLTRGIRRVVLGRMDRDVARLHRPHDLAAVGATRDHVDPQVDLAG